MLKIEPAVHFESYCTWAYVVFSNSAVTEVHTFSELQWHKPTPWRRCAPPYGEQWGHIDPVLAGSALVEYRNQGGESSLLLPDNLPEKQL